MRTNELREVIRNAKVPCLPNTESASTDGAKVILQFDASYCELGQLEPWSRSLHLGRVAKIPKIFRTGTEV